ncbi:MAG TPA: OsmC family protein [Saprospiraceae bacterium]|nr:OsmC family protein [Saprospiraceae bacterium]HMQ84809.1 OsmC family protein [Saprospiraceae bacterium]
MEINIKRLGNAYHLEASNEDGLTIQSDASESIGGGNKAMRPMQILLSSLGGCSAIDIIHLLNKQRQPLDDIQIKITGEREAHKVPSLFTDIHIHFSLYGQIDSKKAERAVELSMEKLCSVKQILDKTAKITWSWEVIEE